MSRNHYDPRVSLGWKRTPSAQQRALLLYIATYTVQYGYPPSTSEICETRGFKSTSQVTHHLRMLQRYGLVETTDNTSRRTWHVIGTPAVSVADGLAADLAAGRYTLERVG